MKDIMLVDVFEPESILLGVAQSLEAIRFPLNSKGLLDYWWAVEDTKETVERKEITDLIGSINDGSLIDRLRMALASDQCTHVSLLVEGVYTPYGTGVQVWKRSDKVYYKYRTYAKMAYTRIQAMLYSLDRIGITVYHSNDIDGTIHTLVSLMSGTQKEEVRVLDKYRKPKPMVKERNIYVETLMVIPGLGEEKAKELIAVCGTPMDVFNMDTEELSHVAGIGWNLAERIHKRVGRI